MEHNPIRTLPLLLAFLVVGANGATPLTERDAVLTALGHNVTLEIVKLDERSDSLALRKAEAGWLPAAVATVGDKAVVYSEGSPPEANTLSAGLSVAQALPGGGTVTATAATDRARGFDGGSAGYSSVLSLGYAQPLLSGAWRHGAPGYEIRVRRLDRRQFTLDQKKKIASSISGVRSLYWDCYGKSSTFAIQRRQVEYAEGKLDSELRRFALGVASPIDTLSARFENLQATQAYLSAMVEDSLALRALARELATRAESLSLALEAPIDLADPPESAELFIAEVSRYDPRLRIFEVLGEKLAVEIDHERNKLLPELEFGANYSRGLAGDAPFAGGQAVSGSTVFELIARYSFPKRAQRLQIRLAETKAEHNEVLALDRRRELVDGVGELLFSWRQELRALEVAVAAHEVAVRKLDASRAAYELGTVDRLALLKDENDYLRATTSLLQRRVALKRLEVACDEMTGRALTLYGVEVQ